MGRVSVAAVGESENEVEGGKAAACACAVAKKARASREGRNDAPLFSPVKGPFEPCEAPQRCSEQVRHFLEQFRLLSLSLNVR